SLLIKFQNCHVECFPAEWSRGFDDFIEGFSFRLAVFYRVFRPKVVTHDFEGGDTASADFRQEALRDDPADGFGKPNSNLLFFRLLEHADDAVDRLAGVNRV